MKEFAAIFLTLLLPSILFGNVPAPSWHTADGKTVEFFIEKGFEFVVDDSVNKHYENPTVEISILIPTQFIDSNIINTFSSILFQNEDISIYTETHEYAGKKRAIFTISEEKGMKSKAVFYFRNNRKGVTHGSMYPMDLAILLKNRKHTK